MGQCLSMSLQLLQAVAEAKEEENDDNKQPQQSQHQINNQQHQSNQQQQSNNNQHASHTTTPSSSKFSPVYPSLPSDAEKHRVRNVYDGDTLTLVDERRVRFLGIDTPEIKEQQPFAQEAKAYTKDRCDKRDIWISYEQNLDKEDHYGRLLCFVWVPADDGSDGYLCVNEGIIAAGFASAYIPNQRSKLHNWDKLVALQSDARSNKRGMWSTFSDDTVYKTANGSAFHKKSCEHLQQIRNLTELKRSEAMEKGLHACRTCLAD